MDDENKLRESVRCLEQYVNRVLEFTSAQEAGQKVWFRGVSSSTHKLVPSLFREVVHDQPGRAKKIGLTNDIANLERSIDTDFYRQAVIFLAKKNIDNNPINRYFLKQHYGIKTRLLDWTESALMALFFALTDDKQQDKDAVVYMLLPFKLNNYAISKLSGNFDRKGYYIFTIPSEFKAKTDLFNEQGRLRVSELFRKYYHLDSGNAESMPPIALYPPYLDERMAAQQSCFTLFGNVFEGLKRPDDAAEDFLYYITIDAIAKKRILKELSVMGINSFSIYPDLDGLGKAINEDYRILFGDHKTQDSIDQVLTVLNDLGGAKIENEEEGS